MAHVPLPPGPRQPLQEQLWEQYHIEVPIVEWNGGRYVRVSCHLYNEAGQIDELVRGLRALLPH
jgi:isopenicillin-N epimerase